MAKPCCLNREIDRFLQERERCYGREMAIAAVGFAVMMVYVLYGNWLALRAVAFPIAICRLFAVFWIRTHRRSIVRIRSLSTDTDFGFRAIVDLDIAFIRSTFYWYALPLAVGLIGFAFAVWWHSGSPWVSGACLVGSIILVLGSRSLNAKTVDKLRALGRRLAAGAK